jgi:D-serine deaminase-like pyridoxal phosphate-dependent protein
VIGLSIMELDTPSLLLNLPKVQQNIDEMVKFATDNNLRLRPHCKTHKSTKLAKLQLDAGAAGITCAKIGEAEVMASAGIKDILIAYPISGELKIRRLCKLLEKNVKLKVAVDNIEQLKLLQRGLENTPYVLEVWIKINSGLNRCGVEPGREVVELAQATVFLSKLKLGGIFTHAGHSYAAKSLDEIQQIGLEEGNAVARSAEACEKVGIPVPIRSVGSTPTYKVAGLVKGINEIRPGNAIFFDAIQAGLGVTSLERCAVTVLGSVVGVYKERIVFDTGSKTLCLDKGAHGNNTVNGFGHVMNHPEITIERLSEEHGVGVFDSRTSLKITDKVQIIPNHVCTVVNQFNQYMIHDGNKVIDVWDVEARGMVT